MEMGSPLALDDILRFVSERIRMRRSYFFGDRSRERERRERRGERERERERERDCERERKRERERELKCCMSERE